MVQMKETKTNNAPAAIGPYSQAITVGNMLFTSGQIPINPATRQIFEGVEAQAGTGTYKCKEHLLRLPAEAIENVVKRQRYLLRI